MATHKGSEGTIKVGSNAVAELRSYVLEESTETIEDTVLSDTSRTFQVGLKSFSGSCDVFWDETDTSGQGALTNGASATLNVYPEGADTGDTFYSGAIIVTGVERSAATDGMVEATISFTGTGALTASTV